MTMAACVSKAWSFALELLMLPASRKKEHAGVLCVRVCIEVCCLSGCKD